MLRASILTAAALLGLALLATPTAAHGSRCVYDVDHNGVVTEADAFAVADRFGTSPGSEPNPETGLPYKRRYDVNRDGYITIHDILLVIANLGECP